MNENAPSSAIMSGTEQTATAKTTQGNVTIIGSTARRELEPAQRVFSTPELLEHILHVCGVYILVRLEYTRKGFKTAIASSVKLLRLMHYVAAPPGDQKLVYTDFGRARTLNLLISAAYLAGRRKMATVLECISRRVVLSSM